MSSEVPFESECSCGISLKNASVFRLFSVELVDSYTDLTWSSSCIYKGKNRINLPFIPKEGMSCISCLHLLSLPW